MSERKFEPMTKAEVVAAQREWARCVTEQDIDQLLELYDFGTPDEPLLFKPTLADVIRLDRAGARAYFVGGDPNYPNDQGFLNRGWKRVEFQSAAGPILKAGGLGYKDMGHYIFVDGDGNATDLAASERVLSDNRGFKILMVEASSSASLRCPAEALPRR